MHLHLNTQETAAERGSAEIKLGSYRKEVWSKEEIKGKTAEETQQGKMRHFKVEKERMFHKKKERKRSSYVLFVSQQRHQFLMRAFSPTL